MATIGYRVLNTTGDTLAFVADEDTLVTDWPDSSSPPKVAVWDGQVALSPSSSGGGT